ncbi:MAG: hypothetical protein GXX79_11390 [Actinomycetales bacterium]|nr:hypothetical protein [Actinomycetales bacterium]
MIARLPSPVDLSSLLVRTDYASERAWRKALRRVSAPVRVDGEVFQAYFTEVEDPSLAGIDPAALVTMPAEGTLDHLFVADSITMRDPRCTLLVLDRGTPCGVPGFFRVTARCAWSVQNNLELANMDFDDFARVVDADGVFDGFAR